MDPRPIFHESLGGSIRTRPQSGACFLLRYGTCFGGLCWTRSNRELHVMDPVPGAHRCRMAWIRGLPGAFCLPFPCFTVDVSTVTYTLQGIENVIEDDRDPSGTRLFSAFDASR